jgi:hypothetical protein
MITNDQRSDIMRPDAGRHELATELTDGDLNAVSGGELVDAIHAWGVLLHDYGYQFNAGLFCVNYPGVCEGAGVWPRG